MDKYKTDKKIPIPIPAQINKQEPIEIDDFLMKTATGTYIEINDLLMDCDNLLNKVSNNLCLFNIINNEGLTINDKLALLQTIFDEKKNNQNFFYSLNSEGQTILHILCEKGYKDIIENLKTKIDLNRLNVKDSNGKFPAEYYIEKYISTECTDNEFYDPVNSVLKDSSISDERKNYLDTLKELDEKYELWTDKNKLEKLVEDVYNGETYEVIKKREAYAETIDKIEKDNLPNKSVEKKRVELKFVNDVLNFYASDVKVNSIDEDNETIKENITNEYEETEGKIKFSLEDLNNKTNIKIQLHDVKNKYIFEPMSLYYSIKSIIDSSETSWIDYQDEQNINIINTPYSNEKKESIENIISNFDDKEKFTEELNKKYGEDNKTKSYFYDNGQILDKNLIPMDYNSLNSSHKIYYIKDTIFNIKHDTNLLILTEKIEKENLNLYILNNRIVNNFEYYNFINNENKIDVFNLLFLYDLCIKNLNVKNVSKYYYSEIKKILIKNTNIIFVGIDLVIPELPDSALTLFLFFSLIIHKNSIHTNNNNINDPAIQTLPAQYVNFINLLDINKNKILFSSIKNISLDDIGRDTKIINEILLAILIKDFDVKYYNNIFLSNIYIDTSIFILFYNLIKFISINNILLSYNTYYTFINLASWNNFDGRSLFYDQKFYEIINEVYNILPNCIFYDNLKSIYGEEFVNNMMCILVFINNPNEYAVSMIYYELINNYKFNISFDNISKYQELFYPKMTKEKYFDDTYNLPIFMDHEYMTPSGNIIKNKLKVKYPILDPQSIYYIIDIADDNVVTDIINRYYFNIPMPAAGTEKELLVSVLFNLYNEFDQFGIIDSNIIDIQHIENNIYEYTPINNFIVNNFKYVKLNEIKITDIIYDNFKSLLTEYYTFTPVIAPETPQNDVKVNEYCNYALTYAKKSSTYNELYRHINYNSYYINNNSKFKNNLTTDLNNDKKYKEFTEEYFNKFKLQSFLQALVAPAPVALSSVTVGGAEPNDYFNIILNKNTENLPKTDDKKDKTSENKIIQAYKYKKISNNTFKILRENPNLDEYKIIDIAPDEDNPFIKEIKAIYDFLIEIDNILNNDITYFTYSSNYDKIFNFNYTYFPLFVFKCIEILTKITKIKDTIERIKIPENMREDFNIVFIKQFEKYKIIINNLIANIQKNYLGFNDKINVFYLEIRNKIQSSINILELYNNLFSINNVFHIASFSPKVYYCSTSFPSIDIEKIPKTYTEFYNNKYDFTDAHLIDTIIKNFFEIYSDVKKFKLPSYIDKDSFDKSIQINFYKKDIINNEKTFYYLNIENSKLLSESVLNPYTSLSDPSTYVYYNIKKYFPLIAEYYFNNLYKTISNNDEYGYKKIVLQELFNIKLKEKIIKFNYEKNPDLDKQTLINFTTSMYNTSINNAIIGDKITNYKLFRDKCARETNELLELVINENSIQNSIMCVIQNKNNKVLIELLTISNGSIKNIVNIKTYAINKINTFIDFIKLRYKNPDLFYDGLNTTICNLVNSEQHKISSNINLEIIKNVFEELDNYLKTDLGADTLLNNTSITPTVGGNIQKKYKLKKIQNGGANITTITRKYKQSIISKNVITDFQKKYRDFIDLDKTELATYNELNTKILQILIESINRELKFQIINSLVYFFYPENTMTTEINKYFIEEDVYGKKIKNELKKQNITDNTIFNNIKVEIINEIKKINEKYEKKVNKSPENIEYDDDYTSLINQLGNSKENIAIKNLYKFAENELKFMILKYNDLNKENKIINTKNFNKFSLFKTLNISLTNVKLSEEIDLFLKNSLYKQINALSAEVPNIDYNNIMISIKSMLMNVKLNEKVSEDFDKTITNLFDLYKNWSAIAGEVLYNSIKEYLDALYEISLYNDMIVELQK